MPTTNDQHLWACALEVERQHGEELQHLRPGGPLNLRPMALLKELGLGGRYISGSLNSQAEAAFGSRPAYVG